MDEERKFKLSADIKEKKKSGTVLMTEGSIWKKLLIFSVPLILGNLLQQLYSTVDSIIVGNCVGKEALAAVGATGSIVNLLIAFSQGASVGAGVIRSLDVFTEKYSGRILNRYIVYTKDMCKEQDILCVPVYMAMFI